MCSLSAPSKYPITTQTFLCCNAISFFNCIAKLFNPSIGKCVCSVRKHHQHSNNNFMFRQVSTDRELWQGNQTCDIIKILALSYDAGSIRLWDRNILGRMELFGDFKKLRYSLRHTCLCITFDCLHIIQHQNVNILIVWQIDSSPYYHHHPTNGLLLLHRSDCSDGT